MSENNTIKIPLFDGTNFNNWKYRVGILLDEKGLRKYIEKDFINILAEDDTRQAEVGVEEKKCISVLVQTIHDSQLEYIKEKKTAKEMFDMLCGIFERKSVANQLLLRRQLLTMKYRETNDIIEHFLAFDTKIRELKSMGAKMEEVDIVVHLLLTLPTSYDNLVTAMETMKKDDLTLEFVKTRLMDEFNKRNGRDSSQNKFESGAMNAKGGFKLICFGCGAVGHKKSQCRGNRFKNKKFNYSNRNTVSANKASIERSSTMCAIVKNFASSSENATVHAANITKENSVLTQIKFVLDSGATQHMVNDKRYFDHLENINELEISVAKKNEMISARQQGEITVETHYKGISSIKTMKNVLYVPDLKCNLLSIRSLTKNGYRIVFEGDIAYVMMNDETQFVAHTNGKLFEVILQKDVNNFAGVSGNNSTKISQSLLHHRLGHLNVYDMKKMVNGKFVTGLDNINIQISIL